LTTADLITLAKSEAKIYGLDPALVCAVVEQESAWNPWSIRYEPVFFTHYVLPILNSHAISETEAQARAFSWGLMQLMGEVARELGYVGDMAALCTPEVGLMWGCKLLTKKLALENGNVPRALLRWNGGGNQNYPDLVLARISKYREAV
jgi:soluble lytic murein transglycosylase-like protein